MKRLLLFLLLLPLLLAACDGGTAAPASGDPAIDRQNAKSTMEMAELRVRQTTEAEATKEAARTLQAAATQEASQAEIDRINKELELRWAGVYATQTLNAGIAQATSQAAQATDQAARETAQASATVFAFHLAETPAAATQVAYANAVALEQQQQSIRIVSLWAWTIAAPIIAIILTVGLAFGIYLFLNWLLEMKSLEGRLVAKNGRVIFLHSLDPKVRDYDPQLLGGPQFLELPPGKMRDAEPDGVFPLDTAGNVLAGPMKSRKVSARWVVPLLDAAIKAGYENSPVFPGHRELNWSGWAWQEAVSWLRLAHIVASQPGKATITHPDFRTVGELRWAIEEGNLMPNLFKKRENANAA